MPENYDRDLIGYAGQPPDPEWPGGKRLALNFVINYEEGSEPSDDAWVARLLNPSPPRRSFR